MSGVATLANLGPCNIVNMTAALVNEIETQDTVQNAINAVTPNKGWYQTSVELIAAHPVGIAGDFATVGAGEDGPSVWVWDTEHDAWEDTATSGLVTSVFNRTGIVTAQTGDYTPEQVGAQPVDATLTALAGVTTAADKLIYATASDTFSTTDLTAAGRAILDDANAAAQRATLGLGTAAVVADNTLIHTTGNESMAGIKSFTDTTDATALGTAGTVLSGGLSVAKTIITGGDLILPKTSGKGIKVDTAAPTFPWADLLGQIMTRGAGGGTAPSFAAYIGGIYQYSFGTTAGVVEVFNEFHVPHDWLPGQAAAYIHTHWSVKDAGSGLPNWLHEISYAKGYGNGVFNSPITVQTRPAYPGAVLEHDIAEVQFVATGGKVLLTANAVSITSGTPTVTGSGFSSAWVGLTVKVIGAGVDGADLDTTISAVASSASLTLANNASTTLTNATNALYNRVIDASLIEPDGLILVRTWRDSSRAADTLNVAPFLHEVDIHYQSTGIGTKDKNTPFYT